MGETVSETRNRGAPGAPRIARLFGPTPVISVPPGRLRPVSWRLCPVRRFARLARTLLAPLQGEEGRRWRARIRGFAYARPPGPRCPPARRRLRREGSLVAPSAGGARSRAPPPIFAREGRGRNEATHSGEAARTSAATNVHPLPSLPGVGARGIPDGKSISPCLPAPQQFTPSYRATARIPIHAKFRRL